MHALCTQSFLNKIITYQKKKFSFDLTKLSALIICVTAKVVYTLGNSIICGSDYDGYLGAAT